VAAAGLVLDEIGDDRVTGRIELGPSTRPLGHRAWGRLHERHRKRSQHRGKCGSGWAWHSAVGFTNTTHFLRSVSSGKVLVEATTINQGRTQQLWSVDIHDGAGKLLAHGEVRLQNLKPAAE